MEASGEEALDWALDALKRAGANASVGRPEVICREIITGEAEGEAKHAEYVEGRGQYAHVRIHVAPASPRSGNAVVNRVIGGAIPSRFIADVTRAVELVLAQGVCGRVVTVNELRTELVAPAPLSQLFGYAVDLRARTRRAGRVTMAFDGYEPRQEHDGGYEPGPALRMPNAPRGGPDDRAAAKPDH